MIGYIEGQITARKRTYDLRLHGLIFNALVKLCSKANAITYFPNRSNKNYHCSDSRNVRSAEQSSD